MQPKKTLQNLSSLFAKIIEICKKKELVIKSMNVEEISNRIKQNFISMSKISIETLYKS